MRSYHWVHHIQAGKNLVQDDIEFHLHASKGRAGGQNQNVLHAGPQNLDQNAVEAEGQKLEQQTEQDSKSKFFISW